MPLRSASNEFGLVKGTNQSFQMTCLCDHPDEHLMLPGQSGHEFIRRLIGFRLLPACTRLSTLTSIWAHKKRAPQTCSALERFTKMSALRGVFGKSTTSKFKCFKDQHRHWQMVA